MQTEEDQLSKKFAQSGEAEKENEAVKNASAEEETAKPSEEAAADTQKAESAKEVSVDSLMSENTALRAELEKVKAEAKDKTDKALLALADAINQKKRAEADVDRERKYGNEKILKALLPVVDSLQLALEHSDKSNEAAKPVIEGVENTLTLFLKELKNFGVEQVDPKGEPFDPQKHQAISMIESAEVAPNCVLNVMQRGYLLNGRVVRPAMVIVAKAVSKPAASAESEHKNINIEA